jgi:hypothetical protein
VPSTTPIAVDQAAMTYEVRRDGKRVAGGLVDLPRLRDIEQLLVPHQREALGRELEHLALGERRHQHDDDRPDDDGDGEQRQPADQQAVGDVAQAAPPTH